MNIQIFGTKKSADTRKAERFFKERGIKFQSIDMKEKGLSNNYHYVQNLAVRTSCLIITNILGMDIIAEKRG